MFLTSFFSNRGKAAEGTRMAVYKIVSQSDDRARNSVTGRKQRAIAKALIAGLGQLTSQQVADNATASIDDEDVKVTAAEVSNYVKAFKSQFPEQSKNLRGVKAGGKGKRAMAEASSAEMDDFLASLNDEEEEKAA